MQLIALCITIVASFQLDPGMMGDLDGGGLAAPASGQNQQSTPPVAPEVDSSTVPDAEPSSAPQQVVENSPPENIQNNAGNFASEEPTVPHIVVPRDTSFDAPASQENARAYEAAGGHVEHVDTGPSHGIRLEVVIHDISIAHAPRASPVSMLAPAASQVVWLKGTLAKDHSVPMERITIHMKDRILHPQDDGLMLHELKVKDGSTLSAVFEAPPAEVASGHHLYATDGTLLEPAAGESFIAANEARLALEASTTVDAVENRSLSTPMSLRVLPEKNLNLPDAAVMVEVQGEDTIAELLQQVSNVLGIPAEDIEMSYEESKLTNLGATVAGAGIRPNTMISATLKMKQPPLSPPTDSNREVRVLTHPDLGLNGKALTLSLKKGSTVQSILVEVSAQEGIPTDDLQVMAEGVAVKSDETIEAIGNRQLEVQLLTSQPTEAGPAVEESEVETASPSSAVGSSSQADEKAETELARQKANLDSASEAQSKVEEKIKVDRDEQQKEFANKVDAAKASLKREPHKNEHNAAEEAAYEVMYKARAEHGLSFHESKEGAPATQSSNSATPTGDDDATDEDGAEEEDGDEGEEDL